MLKHENGEFKKKTALITGAGSGIGREVAFQFQKLGCKLILMDKNLYEIKKEIPNIKDHLFIEIDLIDQDLIFYAFKQIENSIGKINFAFNGAGIGGVFANIEDYPIDDWINVMNINTNAVFLCMKYEIPLIKKAGGGSIVNCASLFSIIGCASDSAYVASKHAVIGLTKSAALEYSTSGIRINAISPGFTNTSMTSNYSNDKKEVIENKHATKRFATTKEIANGVIWLCSQQSSFVCGHNLVIDGGYTI